jgi:ketosteroid isomerase-like protein
MPNTREVARLYAEHITAQRFSDAFDMLADDGKYIVIGTTKASGVYNGRQDVLDRMVPLLSGFISPPAVTFEEPVVDGNRAVLLGGGEGVGPTGAFNQPYYAFVMRIAGDEITEIIEFMDPCQLETGLFGRKLVDA